MSLIFNRSNHRIDFLMLFDSQIKRQYPNKAMINQGMRDLISQRDNKNTTPDRTTRLVIAFALSVITFQRGIRDMVKAIA